MQEENWREGSCNLGVIWLRVPRWNCVLPLNSVGEGCSITWFFSDALIPTPTGLQDVLTSDVFAEKRKTDLLMHCMRMQIQSAQCDTHGITSADSHKKECCGEEASQHPLALNSLLKSSSEPEPWKKCRDAGSCPSWNCSFLLFLRDSSRCFAFPNPSGVYPQEGRSTEGGWIISLVVTVFRSYWSRLKQMLTKSS